MERVLEWKELFANYIQKELQLTLSPEKTKITNLNKNEYIKFLGFQISKPAKRKYGNLVTVGKKRKIRLDTARRNKVKITKILNPKTIYTTRTTNPTLIASWDRDRVLPRMMNNGFIRKYGNTYRGCCKAPWTVLKEPEIIQRFNYIIRGYVNYYTPMSDYPTGIIYIYYLLKMSCAHTISRKRNCSLRKTFKKMGKNLTVTYIEEVQYKNPELENKSKKIKKTESILSWKEILEIIRKTLYNIRVLQKSKTEERESKSISIINKSIDDITNIKTNWRTAFKLSQYCCICGSTDKIEYHHVKHIRKGEVTGFLQVMKQLNRKQIPCCRKCHMDIHAGKHDQTAIKDLYDEQLIIL